MVFSKMYEEKHLANLEKEFIKRFNPVLNNTKIICDNSQKKLMSLYLKPSLKEDLMRLAEINQRSMNNMIETIIVNGIEAFKNQSTNL